MTNAALIAMIALGLVLAFIIASYFIVRTGR